MRAPSPPPPPSMLRHLCGVGGGDAYARRGFRLLAGQRCGDHDVSRYLAAINALKRRFIGLAGAS